MKHLVLIFSVLLVLWITGASYWNVCRVRCHCQPASVQAAETTERGDTDTPTPEELLHTSVKEAMEYLGQSETQKGFFESSSATGDLSGISNEYLEKLKLLLDNEPLARAEVTGHADITGPEAFNLQLGLRRAEFVKSFLISKGLNGGQIEISTKGSSLPAASNKTPEGRAANRRSEIKVII